MSNAASLPPALLFDLDGTLVDTVELILASVDHAFAGRTAAPSRNEWVAGIGRPLATQLAQWARDEADLAELVTRYREHQREHLDAGTRCFADVPATLDRLRAAGHPLGIVTSKADQIAIASLRAAGILERFDVVIGCDSCARHKPDPEPVLLALERLGRQPEEGVFVGDSPHDMAAGRAAGVITVAALWGPFSRESLATAAPDHYIDCMADLLPLVERVAAERRRDPAD